MGERVRLDRALLALAEIMKGILCDLLQYGYDDVKYCVRVFRARHNHTTRTWLTCNISSMVTEEKCSPISIYTRTHACARAHAHTRTHTYTHTHTHTHLRTYEC